MAKGERQEDVTVIDFGPECDPFDESALQAMQEELLSQAQAADPPLLLLDMSRMEFISSVFIEMVSRAWKRVNARGGRMVLCGVTPFCAEVLRTTRLDTLWKNYPTRDEAIAALRQAAAE